VIKQFPQYANVSLSSTGVALTTSIKTSCHPKHMNSSRETIDEVTNDKRTFQRNKTHNDQDKHQTFIRDVTNNFGGLIVLPER
jgi:hypothetical protein